MALFRSLLSFSLWSTTTSSSTASSSVVEDVTAATRDAVSHGHQGDDNASRQTQQHDHHHHQQHLSSHLTVGLKSFVFRLRHHLLQLRLVAFSSQAPLRRFSNSRIGLICIITLLSLVAFLIPLPRATYGGGGGEDTEGRFFASDFDTPTTSTSTRRLPFFSNGDAASASVSSSRSSTVVLADTSSSYHTTSTSLILSTLSSSVKLLVVAPIIKLQRTQQRTTSPYTLESRTSLLAKGTPLCCIPTIDIIAHHRSSALFSEGCTPSTRSPTTSTSLHAKVLRAVVDMARSDAPLCSTWNKCLGIASALSTPLFLTFWVL